MRTLVSNLPGWAKPILRRTKNIGVGLKYSGNQRYCPVCRQSSSQFKPSGVVPRDDALCVWCGSLERHRLTWLFMQQKTNFFDSKSLKMLHIAPEPCFESRFKQHLGDNYLSADLFSSSAMVKMDICDIQYPDQSFDVIYCSHVFEHVLDDKQAMREFFRVLKGNGWAILNVPINRETTFEDASIVDPQARLQAFGQEDHVRCYGRDYVDRLRESGFKVEIFRVDDLANADEAVQMGLTSASGEVYFCTK